MLMWKLVLLNLTLKEAYDISEKVHSQVEANFKVLHCHVHINPTK